MCKSILVERFDGNPVEFQSGDAFVNITSMCAQFGRRPADFLGLPASRRFLSELFEALGVLPECLVSLKNADGLCDMQHVWAHPDLALECARWLSPRLTIWCHATIRRILSAQGGDVSAVEPARRNG